MIEVRIADIERAVAENRRPTGYLQRLTALAHSRTAAHLLIPTLTYRQLAVENGNVHAIQYANQHFRGNAHVSHPAGGKSTRASNFAQQGRDNWARLHRSKPDCAWLDQFTNSLPCGDCKLHWKKLLQSIPPDYASDEAWFEWTVAVHNAVNQRLGKPIMPLWEARDLWIEKPITWDAPRPLGGREKIDVVIPYITGEGGSEELKHALRGIDRYLIADATVWIVGDDPGTWLNKSRVNFIPQARAEKGPRQRFRDWQNKVLTAARDPRMGPQFIIAYDDTYFISPTSVECLRLPYAMQKREAASVAAWKTDGGWEAYRKFTMERLAAEGIDPIYDFETHAPEVYETAKFLDMVDRFNVPHTGLAVHTLYHNLHKPDYDPMTAGGRCMLYRIGNKRDWPKIRRDVGTHKIFNHTAAFDDGVKNILSERLGDTCRFEADVPDVTLLTPTGDRPKSFALLEQWIGRQSFKGNIQWIVADDGVTPTACTMGQTYIRREPSDGNSQAANLLAMLPHIKADNVLVIEDDDWYAPDYIATMLTWLKDAPLVGLKTRRYYRPRHRQWEEFGGGFGILACTGLRREALATFESVLKSGLDGIDVRLWKTWGGGKKHADAPHTLHVGMKHAEGRANVTADLLAKRLAAGRFKDDPDGMKLRQWIGEADYAAVS